MKINLVSLGQLLERGYVMNMEDKMLRVFDENKKLILKAPLSVNRTFKIEILRCWSTGAWQPPLAKRVAFGTTGLDT